MFELVAIVKSAPTGNEARLSETELRYDAFLGDVSGRVGSLDLTTHWGWVPVLDFALSLAEIACRLKASGRETYEFTESEATIDFALSGDTVTVTTSYAEGEGLSTLDELRWGAASCLRQTVNEVARLGPGVEQHPALRRSLEALGHPCPDE